MSIRSLGIESIARSFSVRDVSYRQTHSNSRSVVNQRRHRSSNVRRFSTAAVPEGGRNSENRINVSSGNGVGGKKKVLLLGNGWAGFCKNQWERLRLLSPSSSSLSSTIVNQHFSFPI
jgi:hypothetical protein